MLTMTISYQRKKKIIIRIDQDMNHILAAEELEYKTCS